MKPHWLIIPLLVFCMAAYSQNAFETEKDHSEIEKFITVQGLSIASIGEFKDNWKTAGGFYIGYGIIYSDNGALLFQAGIINFKENEDAGYQNNSEFRLTPFMVGGRYYMTKEKFRPFLQALSGIGVISQNWATADTSVANTEVHLAFQVGIGLDILLFNGLQIEAVASYNSHLLDPPKPYNITGLEYSVGLVWRFSGQD